MTSVLRYTLDIHSDDSERPYSKLWKRTLLDLRVVGT